MSIPLNQSFCFISKIEAREIQRKKTKWKDFDINISKALIRVLVKTFQVVPVVLGHCSVNVFTEEKKKCLNGEGSLSHFEYVLQIENAEIANGGIFVPSFEIPLCQEQTSVFVSENLKIFLATLFLQRFFFSFIAFN